MTGWATGWATGCCCRQKQSLEFAPSQHRCICHQQGAREDNLMGPQAEQSTLLFHQSGAASNAPSHALVSKLR